jgi:hypothetical protein
LEDVLELLLQEEILDESDKMERISARRAMRALRKWKLFVKKKKIARGEADLHRQHLQPKMLSAISQLVVSMEKNADAQSVLPTEASPLLRAQSPKTDESGWKLSSFPSFFGA